MKTRQFHFNKEFIKGFVEGLISEYELGLGPFLNLIHDFTVDVTMSKPVRVVIPFAIESDDRDDLHVYFDINNSDSTEIVRMKVQLVIEQMIAIVKSSENEHQ